MVFSRLMQLSRRWKIIRWAMVVRVWTFVPLLPLESLQ